MRPREIAHIYETCVYCRDLGAARTFYEGVMGLRLVSDFAPTALTFRISALSVLIVFDPGLSAHGGRSVPSHGHTAGEGHVAFRIGPDDLAPWREHLRAHGLAIEQEVTWPTGARSLYVRDPAGNSVELIDGPLWSE